MIFVGVDWAEDHHDVDVEDEHGARLTHGRVSHGVEGVACLHAMLAEHVDEPDDVVVGIEIDRGLLVRALVAAGYRVYAINPRAVARYRDRHSVSGAKSDAGDAKVLADLVRTDRHNHRRVAGDSDELDALRVVARQHQNLIWARQRHTNQLRHLLRDYYPAALEAFDDLDAPDAIEILKIAAHPEQGRALSRAKIAAALRRAGRVRQVDERAIRIQQALRSPHLAAATAVTNASAVGVEALVALIRELNRQIAVLETELTARFEHHPDAEILRSQPGLGNVLGARVLSEFGDDPDRYADAKARRNYAGTSPITKASGKSHLVLARFVRNDRLANACDRWALSVLSASPGARRYYDDLRATGKTHRQATRALSNKLVGILHGCLTSRTVYNEAIAWKRYEQQVA